MASDSFKTPRLMARRIAQADFAVLRNIHTDWGTMQTLSADGSIPTEEMSRTIFDRHLWHWDEHGFGVWLFSQPSTSEVIGYCGLRRCDLRGAEETELFFALRSQFFRMGFGTEIGRVVLDTGFRQIGLSSIIGFTLRDNVGCRALMTKLGMKYEGLIEHAGLTHLMYRRLRHPHE